MDYVSGAGPLKPTAEIEKYVDYFVCQTYKTTTAKKLQETCLLYTSDRECPFYVNTPNGLSIYVYGTKFNVSAYEDEMCIRDRVRGVRLC